MSEIEKEIQRHVSSNIFDRFVTFFLRGATTHESSSVSNGTKTPILRSATPLEMFYKGIHKLLGTYGNAWKWSGTKLIGLNLNPNIVFEEPQAAKIVVKLYGYQAIRH